MNTLTSRTYLALSYACTILVSAFLLFQVQPIISKFILPWFGGTPAVWTTAMVFFQTLLFGGYAYAHFSQRVLSPRMQCALHLLLITAAVAALPIAPGPNWKPTSADWPTFRILALLTVCVGLPYFVLSSTGPLVQAWFSRTFPGRSPYRLYALSNAGSLLALLSYPFFVEPRLDSLGQSKVWTISFFAFALLSGWIALKARRPVVDYHPENSPGLREKAHLFDHPPLSRRVAWIGLPAFASLMLLATTNHVCQDVAVMPLLWVVPLSLYLLSFIISFDHERWYLRKPYALAAMLALGLVAGMDQLITADAGIHFSFVQEVTLHFVALFLVCMLCHGELVRLRPHPRYLTSFYLMIAAGGALGGLFVSLVAPVLFSTFFEWRLGLLGGLFLAAFVGLNADTNAVWRQRFVYGGPILLLFFLGLSCVPYLQQSRVHGKFVTLRNFYGVISVVERDKGDRDKHMINLYSGRIVHGVQFVDPLKSLQPTTYYGYQSGVGQEFAALKSRPELRVGMVGLGVATLAAYARPGDYFCFYEINPDVEMVAREDFTYLKNCRGITKVILGDGRLSLERQPPQNFDLLVLDVFSGDAVPTHLLTAEAFQMYRKHLKADGRIAVHISNRYLDLAPVVARVAQLTGFDARKVSSAVDREQAVFPADWMLLRPSSGTPQIDPALLSDAPLWTDGYSNLFEIMK